MAHEFIPGSASYAFDASTEPDAAMAGEGMQQLFDQRTSILKTKLEVFATEIFDRLRIRQQNLSAIDRNEERLSLMITDVSRQANYMMRDRNDALGLERLQFDLEAQKREQDTSCWRDTADVMKDFLEVWEALAQARARSVFLSGYG
jgi:hypothetical protein